MAAALTIEVRVYGWRVGLGLAWWLLCIGVDEAATLRMLEELE